MIGIVRAAFALPEGITRLINVWIMYIMPTVATSESFHPFGQVEEDRVDDLSILQDHDDTACQSDNQGGTHNIFTSVEEEFDQFVRRTVIGYSGCNPQDKEQGGDLHDIPAVTHYPCDKVKDRKEQ